MLTEDDLKDRIAKALKSGGDTLALEDVVIGLQEGRFQMFWNEHGCCICQVVQTPRWRYLDCFVVAGELPGVMDLQPQVEAHARSQGCRWMETTARAGWKKVLPSFGWKPKKILFVKELGNG
jgi:hypothetical protein